MLKLGIPLNAVCSDRTRPGHERVIDASSRVGWRGLHEVWRVRSDRLQADRRRSLLVLELELELELVLVLVLVLMLMMRMRMMGMKMMM
jgi:hypothetical protein